MSANQDRERRELESLLDADPAEASPAPLWPAVSAALAGRRSRAGRRFDPFVAFGLPAAVAAGLLLGIFTGAGPDTAPNLAAADAGEETVAELAFAAEEGTTLGEIWWGTWNGESFPDEGGAS